MAPVELVFVEIFKNGVLTTMNNITHRLQPMSVSDRKRGLRKEIWELLEERGVARFPRPAQGRIPNYEGSEAAARRILGAVEFQRADVVKVNPDYPQLEVQKGCSGRARSCSCPRRS